MNEDPQHIHELRKVIAVAIDEYAEANPTLPARAVVTVLAEAMVNIGIAQLGKEQMVYFVKSLVTVTEGSVEGDGKGNEPD